MKTENKCPRCQRYTLDLIWDILGKWWKCLACGWNTKPKP